MVWHKLYASAQRKGFPEKAIKDRQQATVLAALLTEHFPEAVLAAFSSAPEAIREAARTQGAPLLQLLAKHEEARGLVESCLAV